jgi:hypothetical protein
MEWAGEIGLVNRGRPGHTGGVVNRSRCMLDGVASPGEAASGSD